MQEILRLFPPSIAPDVFAAIKDRFSTLEEIRLRVDKPIELIFTSRSSWIKEVIFSSKDRDFVLTQLSEHSLYRLETELKEGFITIDGGHRVGLAGKVHLHKGQVAGMHFISSFNIRIAKQIRHLALDLLPYLDHGQTYGHTLIIGSPQAGKTTLLRDLARLISSGTYRQSGKKVTVIDERSELAASKDGVPQFDLGRRTDVLDRCPKATGMMMAIRSLSPEVIIVDEIGKKEDVLALLDVFHAGVSIICTVHGSSLDEVAKRFTLKPLFLERIFQHYIFVSHEASIGFTYTIYDQERNPLRIIGPGVSDD